VPNKLRDIKLVPTWSKLSWHISHIAFYILGCSILGIDGVPNEVVEDVIIAMQTTPLTICSPTVSPHVSDISDLSFGLIMDM
jgi:hypothetical protein